MNALEIVGRSSSHFTRVARIFALELGIEHGFRPVRDLTVLDVAAYADNPALKIPVLVDGDGACFGTENICRTLARRASPPGRVVLRGEVASHVVANAEELTLQAMTTEVAIVMSRMAGGDRGTPPKLTESLAGSLAWLDAHLDRALEALPPERALSFLEVSLFCLVSHLPFREVMSVDRYPRLGLHVERFGARETAAATVYRYDVF